MYPDISLHIDGGWTKGSGGKTIPVLNPATGESIGNIAHAETADLERAARAAAKGFQAWRTVSAFTPWNFPINQAVRKISCAVAAGCSIVIKGPEDTPGSVAELVRAFVDAGLPAGVINLVYGVPSEISEYLVPHPVIRKISFTGSSAVGKHLAALAGKHMKRVTMELGGHAPGIVFEDADLDQAVKVLAGGKFRNAGQVCIAPTRLLVQEPLYEKFVDKFTAAAKAVKVGDGLDSSTR